MGDFYKKSKESKHFMAFLRSCYLHSSIARNGGGAVFFHKLFDFAVTENIDDAIIKSNEAFFGPPTFFVVRLGAQKSPPAYRL